MICKRAPYAKSVICIVQIGQWETDRNCRIAIMLLQRIVEFETCWFCAGKAAVDGRFLGSFVVWIGIDSVSDCCGEFDKFHVLLWYFRGELWRLEVIGWIEFVLKVDLNNFIKIFIIELFRREIISNEVSVKVVRMYLYG